MRKTKIIMYCLSAVILLAIVAYLNGYRLTVVDASRVYNEKTHFSPAVVVYEKEVKDLAVVVVQNDAWFQSIRITRSFGFLWKANPEQSSPVNKNILDPSLTDKQVITGMIARSVWPEKLESMTQISIYGEDPIALTPAQWWTITGLLQPVKWTLIDASVPIGERTELITMTDASGTTVTIYNDLNVHGTGYYMIVVDDHQEGSPNRQYYVSLYLLNKVEPTVNQAISSAKLIKAIATTTFVSGAGLTDEHQPWPVDFVSLTADQSEEIKGVLNFQSWISESSYPSHQHDMTLVDNLGTTYSFSKIDDRVYINIRRRVGERFESESWSAPASILNPVQKFLKTLEVITPPSSEFIATTFIAAQLGYTNQMCQPAYFDELEDPSYRFALTSAQNTQLKSVLKLDRWNLLSQSFVEDAEINIFPTIVLTGDDHERIFISMHNNAKAVALVERQGQTTYYSLDPQWMEAARNYLLTVFVPKGPTAEVKAMTFAEVTFNNDVMFSDLSLAQMATLKSLLKIDTWKQASGVDRFQGQFIVHIITSKGYSVYLSDYKGQILIEIYVYKYMLPELARYGYLAPSSLKAPLMTFIETLKK